MGAGAGGDDDLLEPDIGNITGREYPVHPGISIPINPDLSSLVGLYQIEDKTAVGGESNLN